MYDMIYILYIYIISYIHYYLFIHYPGTLYFSSVAVAEYSSSTGTGTTVRSIYSTSYYIISYLAPAATLSQWEPGPAPATYRSWVAPASRFSIQAGHLYLGHSCKGVRFPISFGLRQRDFIAGHHILFHDSG